MIAFFSCLQNFHEQVMQKADIIQATGDAIVTIPDVACLTPRYLLFAKHTWLWTQQGLSTQPNTNTGFREISIDILSFQTEFCFVSLSPLKMHQKTNTWDKCEAKKGSWVNKGDKLSLSYIFVCISLFAIENKANQFPRCRYSLHMSQVAHQVGAHPSVCSMKRLGIFLLPPGWDATPLQRYPQQ